MSTRTCHISPFLAVLCLAGSLLGWVAMPSGASAAVVVWQQGLANKFTANYQGTADTFVEQYNPTFNYGAGKTLDQTAWVVGQTGFEDRSLIRFDLSSFAGQYSKINSITLDLEVATTTGVGNIRAHTVLPTNAGWVEGTAQGAAQSGAACWAQRGSNSANWAGSAGLNTPGVDYDATPLGSTFVSVVGNWDISFAATTTQLTSLVDTWTAPNNPGLLLMTDTGGIRFRTKDRYFTDFGQSPPTLTIDYVAAAPEPSTLALALIGFVGLIAGTSPAWRKRLCRYIRP